VTIGCFDNSKHDRWLQTKLERDDVICDMCGKQLDDCCCTYCDYCGERIDQCTCTDYE